jgi:hypothetical protein
VHVSHSHLEQGQFFSKQFPQLHLVQSQLVHLQLFITFKFYGSLSRLINFLKDTLYFVFLYAKVVA